MTDKSTILAPVRSRPIVALLAAVLVAAACYGLWWRHLADEIRQDLAAFVAQRNAQGWTIGTGAVGVTGFPFRLLVTLTAPSVADPRVNRWEGPPLVVAVPPLAMTRPHIEAPGPHHLQMRDLPPVTVTVGRASADLVIGTDGTGSATIGLADIGGDLIKAGGLTVEVHRLVSAPVPHDRASWDADLRAERVTLPADPGAPFGRQVAALHLHARLMGSLRPGVLADSLAGWRDDGGTVEIDTLALDWPPFGLSGKGTLALDRRLQPMLASQCTMSGLPEAVDALVRAGSVRPSDANMAKLVLGLLMKPGPEGVKVLDIPLSIQDSRLSIGPVALLKVPDLVW
jgi:hypothetical protein